MILSQNLPFSIWVGLCRRIFHCLVPLIMKSCYVHKSMEDFLSPAFYLTPPLDTGSPNVIYINRANSHSNLELFTTLSHEGFPGHLYQTVFFGRTQPADIRYLITSGGYVEGWATYVESYGYQYAASLLTDKAASDLTALMWKNRCINLCIYSLLDTASLTGLESDCRFTISAALRNPRYKDRR